MTSGYQTKRRDLLLQWGALHTERAEWFSHWQEISQYLLPRSGRFFIQDRANAGGKKHGSIIDGSGTKALRTLAAGLMAGMTSPARPWFRLATTDTELMEVDSVQVWLDEVTDTMREIFSRSNTYRALHSMYEELGAFGTGTDIIVDDYEYVIHHHPLTAGQYVLACDDSGRVTTLIREYEMTASQMVDKFGIDNVSVTVKNLYENGSKHTWIPVMHSIVPRSMSERSYGKPGSRNMAWKSCYWEKNGPEDDVLRESGFRRFPALCPRWAVTGEDPYGSSPAMDALGDIKQLQAQQKRKGQAIDYMVRPPLQVPTAMKSSGVAMLPGGVSYVDGVGQNQGIRSAWDVKINLEHLREDIMDVRQRISSTFYQDLFLMLAQDDRSGITAREIAERHEEKLLMLGPVLERLHNEFLQPMIDNTFDRMIAVGLVPPPPREMAGQELKVEFVSMLAQAQRAIGVQSVDRLIGTVGSLAVMQVNSGIQPTALDKLDIDAVIDQYADMLGVDPTLVTGNEQVAIIRDQRAQQQAAAQRMAQAEQAAATAKTASQADTSGQNALTDVMGMFSGYSVPGVNA